MEQRKMGLDSKNAGRRVQTLRKLLGWNQSELSERSGISQSLISHIERGTRSATQEVLLKLSAATRTPITFFEQSTPLFTGSLTFRKTSSAIAKDQVMARFEEAERVANLLSEKVQYKLPSLPYREAQEHSELSMADIETLARQTRISLGLNESEPIKNLTRTLERNGIVVAPIADKSEHLFAKHDGVTRPTSESYRPVIAYATGAPGDRERFTKAHELGHVVLHSNRETLGDKQRESEANRFAGAFLLPRSMMTMQVSDTMNLNGYVLLKAKTGVSIQATLYRARTLELISDKRYKSLMVQVSSRGWRNEEPVGVFPEKPILLAQMLKKKYGRNPLMLASHDLGVPASLLAFWAHLDQQFQDSSIPEREGNVVPLFG